jgi:hypothetical protein
LAIKFSLTLRQGLSLFAWTARRNLRACQFNFNSEHIMNEFPIIARVAQGLLAVGMVLASGLFIQLTMA